MIMRAQRCNWCGLHRDTLILTSNESALRDTSAVLLKLKGGDHVLAAHVASTCHSRRDCRAKKYWNNVHFIRGKKTQRQAAVQIENDSRERNAEKKKRITMSQLGQFEMTAPSIADIANHIMNLIDRTISSLALPDKSGESSPEVRRQDVFVKSRRRWRMSIKLKIALVIIVRIKVSN